MASACDTLTICRSAGPQPSQTIKCILIFYTAPSEGDGKTLWEREMGLHGARWRYCQQLQLILSVLAYTLADSRTPYTVAKRKVHTLTPSSQISNTGPSLRTCERQKNGMQILHMFRIHKMAAQVQPDVTSVPSTHTLACVQVIYCTSCKVM